MPRRGIRIRFATTLSGGALPWGSASGWERQAGCPSGLAARPGWPWLPRSGTPSATGSFPGRPPAPLRRPPRARSPRRRATRPAAGCGRCPGSAQTAVAETCCADDGGERVAGRSCRGVTGDLRRAPKPGRAERHVRFREAGAIDRWRRPGALFSGVPARSVEGSCLIRGRLPARPGPSPGTRLPVQCPSAAALPRRRPLRRFR